MFLLVLTGLLLLPVLEVALFVWLGLRFGWDPTLLALCAASFAGWALLSLALKASLKTAVYDVVRSGGSVGRAVADRAISTLGAGLLLLPGFLTGVAGLLLFVPPIRARVRRRLVAGFTVIAIDPRQGRVRRDVIDVDEINADPFDPSSTPSGPGTPRELG